MYQNQRFKDNQLGKTLIQNMTLNNWSTFQSSQPSAAYPLPKQPRHRGHHRHGGLRSRHRGLRHSVRPGAGDGHGAAGVGAGDGSGGVSDGNGGRHGGHGVSGLVRASWLSLTMLENVGMSRLPGAFTVWCCQQAISKSFQVCGY